MPLTHNFLLTHKMHLFMWISVEPLVKSKSDFSENTALNIKIYSKYFCQILLGPFKKIIKEVPLLPMWFWNQEHVYCVVTLRLMIPDPHMISASSLLPVISSLRIAHLSISEIILVAAKDQTQTLMKWNQNYINAQLKLSCILIVKQNCLGCNGYWW